MEQELSAGLSEWQIAELVEHDEVEPGQVIGEPSLAAGAGLALPPGDQGDGGVEAAARAAADASPRDSEGDMAVTGSGAANQHGVALLGDEPAARQMAD